MTNNQNKEVHKCHFMSKRPICGFQGARRRPYGDRDPVVTTDDNTKVTCIKCKWMILEYVFGNSYILEGKDRINMEYKKYMDESGGGFRY
jgi:hypothetical protein